jgi:hypothetical protein
MTFVTAHENKMGCVPPSDFFSGYFSSIFRIPLPSVLYGQLCQHYTPFATLTYARRLERTNHYHIAVAESNCFDEWSVNPYTIRLTDHRINAIPIPLP